MEFFIEVFLIGVGLSMDAFAVSICKGLSMTRVNKHHCFMIGLFFGGFQMLMPFIGWLVGTAFSDYVAALDHWIAFVLLAYIGGKMIVEVVRGGGEDDDEALAATDPPLDLKELLMLAVATSIDALAVGVTFAFSGTPILPAICIIGVTTFTISVGGVFVGNQFGTRYEKKATIAGGVILILIGLKILIEGLL